MTKKITASAALSALAIGISVPAFAQRGMTLNTGVGATAPGLNAIQLQAPSLQGLNLETGVNLDLNLELSAPALTPAALELKPVAAVASIQAAPAIKTIAANAAKGRTAGNGAALTNLYDNGVAKTAAAVAGIAATPELGARVAANPAGLSLAAPATLSANRMTAPDGLVWRTLKDAWKTFWAWVGFGVKKAQTPEVMLEKHKDDVKEALAAQAEALASFMAQLDLKEQQAAAMREELSKKEDTLVRIARLINKSDTDDDSKYLEKFKTVKAAKTKMAEQLQDLESDIEGLNTSVATLEKRRERYKEKAEQRYQEIRDLLSAEKQAKADEELAKVWGSFDDAMGPNDDFQKAKEKIEQRAAEARAKRRIVEKDGEAGDIDAEIAAEEAELGLEDDLAEYLEKAKQAEGK